MPAEQVRKSMKRLKGRGLVADVDVSSLAAEFNVSDSAMQIQLVNLGLNLPR
jgi:hypothetical protein